MKMLFQIVRDGEAIYETTTNQPNEYSLGDVTARAIDEFQKISPAISLLDENIFLKWTEAPTD
jgi:hypothetical protein